jgi:hypothetical protein
VRFLAGLIAGLIAGYCTVLFGWVAYSNIAAIRDFEGAAAMRVAFFFAPPGCGSYGRCPGSVWFQWRRPRRS